MLPEPTLTLTLPSLHDGTVLDCRVFHPRSLSPASTTAPPWQRHAAVVAPPYAPLGGCYDDPVVDAVAATLLRLGFLVATFNFRGASGSAGRTSWTGRAETADYMSVVGFVSYYTHHLDPFRRQAAAPPAVVDESPGSSEPALDAAAAPPATSPVLLLAGYSYGSLITTQLPALATILDAFETPAVDTPAAEIRHRAEYLADLQNTVLAEAREQQDQQRAASSAAAAATTTATSPRRTPLGLRVGGDEDRRSRSRDPAAAAATATAARPSFSAEAEERLRRGVADRMARAKRGRAKEGRQGGASGGGREDDEEEQGEARLQPPAHPPRHRPAYLLVSPLQGAVSHLATLSFTGPLSRWWHARHAPASSSSGEAGPPSAPRRSSADQGASSPDGRGAAPSPACERALVQHPTLAIYGDRDVFVSARRLRDWARRMEAAPGSRFRAHEVSTAGHFWTEKGTLGTMLDAVRTFAQGVLGDHGP